MQILDWLLTWLLSLNFKYMDAEMIPNGPKRGRPRKLPSTSEAELEGERKKRRRQSELLRNDWVDILIPGYSEAEMNKEFELDRKAIAEARKDGELEIEITPAKRKPGRPRINPVPPEDWEAILFNKDLDADKLMNVNELELLGDILEPHADVDNMKHSQNGMENRRQRDIRPVVPSNMSKPHERLLILKYRLICDAPLDFDENQFLEKMSGLDIKQRNDQIHNGIALSDALKLSQLFGLDNLELSAILNCASSSFKNRTNDTKLNQNASDRLMALMSVFEEGYRVFKNRNDFFIWLRSPLSALQNNPPFSLLGTIVGMEEVKLHIMKHRICLYSK